MYLPKLQIPEQALQYYETSGLDTYECCFDKEHFTNYPHDISYQFNTRGFRDIEWPDITPDTVWCLGDSFTVGLACPIEYIWVNILRHQIDRSCINVSMDGASNQFIARKAEYILENVKPKHMIIHWSYFHRREDPDERKSDQTRRIYTEPKSTDEEDYENIISCIKHVGRYNTKILHSFVPNCSKEIYYKKVLQYITENDGYYVTIEQVDYGRDGHHYGPNTHKLFAEAIKKSGFLSQE